MCKIHLKKGSMEIENFIDYIHGELNEEATAIGGYYVFTEETRLPYRDQEILYLTGYGVMDTSCCGEGGCGFSLVYGFINDWKSGKNEAGKVISKIIPVRGEATQKAIRGLIVKREVVNQVNFM